MSSTEFTDISTWLDRYWVSEIKKKLGNDRDALCNDGRRMMCELVTFLHFIGLWYRACFYLKANLHVSGYVIHIWSFDQKKFIDIKRSFGRSWFQNRRHHLLFFHSFHQTPCVINTTRVRSLQRQGAYQSGFHRFRRLMVLSADDY